MLCPYCLKEMTKGYIQSRDSLGWSPKKRLFARGRALSGHLAEIPFDCTVAAYHCGRCRKIIIDCGNASKE